MLERKEYLEQVKSAFEVHPVVALLGPRQCGKTTIARAYAKEENVPGKNYFDLEEFSAQQRLESAQLTLGELEDLIIIDEVQMVPELFKTLRVLVDNPDLNQRYLILGSASRDLINQSSETLAGRIEYIEVHPFSLFEIEDLKKFWLCGGFPKSFLAESIEKSNKWRKSYIRTYLERDIPNLGFNIPPQMLHRFWMMLAHYHGNIFNASEIGNSLTIAGNTVRRYLDILTGTFMVRELLPWFENISKRQVKSPKIYFRDSGIYHSLLNIYNEEDLLTSPKLGASWEGVALEEIIRYHNADSQECYFWGVHNQGELDLLIVKDGKRLGFEFKYTDKPKFPKSQRMAYETLHLDELTFISPGVHDFPLSENVRAIGLEEYITMPN